MKRLTVFLLSISALMAFLACQRENAGTDPSKENEVKEVTTQFVLNVTAAPSTKMSATAVQMAQNFRGIENGRLFTYTTGITGTPYVLKTTGTDAAADKEYDLGLFFAAGGLDNGQTEDTSGDSPVTTNNNETGSSRRVLQLSIPVNTDAVLFYGKAIKASGLKDSDYGATSIVDSDGHACTAPSGTPGNTIFKAEKILSDGLVVNQYDATARLMIAVINDILSRGVSANGSVTVGTGQGAQTFDNLPAITWAQLGHQYELDHFPTTTRYKDTEDNKTNGVILGRPIEEGLEEILGECYYLFTYIKPVEANVRPNGEYRAGSSAAIKAMIADMYRVISAASTSDPTTAHEANAKRLANVILDRAQLYFDNTTGAYKDISTIKELLVTQYKVITDSQWTNYYAKAQDLNKYPYEDFGVPEGAAQLGFHVYGTDITDTTDPRYIDPQSQGYPAKYPNDEFYYYHPNKPLVNPTMTEFEPRKYLYPAELWYYVNSPIRTSTNEHLTANDFPNGVNPWNAEASWTGWNTPGKVESSTRGVAVINSINYGVALLKSSVKYADNLTLLQDNRHAMTDEEDKTINLSAAQLQLRGILVGGVNPRMNWQFIRKYTSTGNHEELGDLSLFDGVIYDHSLPSNAVPTASPNYTLVYDNYNSSEGGTADKQNDVYVALEFVNGGESFWGRDNLIPSGGVFYLVALLPKPTNEQGAGLNWPTDHQIPPVWGVDDEEVPQGKVAGESKQIPRVFIQDFMTTVTFIIGQTSLQNAYYSVPDLRASQMSLGLSVDLQWTQGLDYEKVL